MKLEDVLPHILQQLKGNQWHGLLLAVSGGLDSICLANYFIQNQKKLGIKYLAIAHIHHSLREGTADLDAEFVKSFASSKNVPFYLKHIDGKALQHKKGSLEENAREARYEALSKFVRTMASQCSCKESDIAIVTAHHGNDQAETLYYRMRRGVSLKGLGGIQAVRNFSDEIPQVKLFRPFLQTSRKELLEYAQEQKLSWREDESNSDESYARNRIRHSVLPHLEKNMPEVSSMLCHIAKLAQSAFGKVLKVAENAFGPAVIPESQWPFDPKFSCYEKVLAIDVEKIEAFFGSPRCMPAAMAEMFRLWLSEKGFLLPLKEFGTSIPYPFLQRFRCKSIIMEKCRKILWICDVSSAITTNCKRDNLYLNADKFSGLVGQWRYRSKGDSLWPADEKIKARKLEHWLREQGIPQWMHDRVPLFANGSRVFFVEGVRHLKK